MARWYALRAAIGGGSTLIVGATLLGIGDMLVLANPSVPVPPWLLWATAIAFLLVLLSIGLGMCGGYHCARLTAMLEAMIPRSQALQNTPVGSICLWIAANSPSLGYKR